MTLAGYIKKGGNNANDSKAQIQYMTSFTCTHTHTMCSQTKLDSHVEPISLTEESCGAKRTVTHLLLLYLPAADRPG